MRPDPTGDKELTDGVLRGDPQAWGRLCETYGEPLYLYAYHRTGGDRFAAEDVVQTTLLAAVESISSYRRQVPLFAWLCGIARHKATDESRRARREGIPLEALGEALGEESPPSSPPGVGSWLGREPLPEEVVDRAETRAAVVEALWCLPEDYREALVRRYVRGETVTEVAALLGRSYKATESLLSRAREAFRRSLMEVELHEKRCVGHRQQQK